MSHWNIRVVEYDEEDGHYEFREIYYEDDESLRGHASVSLMGDVKQELEKTIKRLQTALTLPYIKEKEFYKKSKKDKPNPECFLHYLEGGFKDK